MKEKTEASPPGGLNLTITPGEAAIDLEKETPKRQRDRPDFAPDSGTNPSGPANADEETHTPNALHDPNAMSGAASRPALQGQATTYFSNISASGELPRLERKETQMM